MTGLAFNRSNQRTWHTYTCTYIRLSGLFCCNTVQPFCCRFKPSRLYMLLYIPDLGYSSSYYSVKFAKAKATAIYGCVWGLWYVACGYFYHVQMCLVSHSQGSKLRTSRCPGDNNNRLRVWDNSGTAEKHFITNEIIKFMRHGLYIIWIAEQHQRQSKEASLKKAAVTTQTIKKYWWGILRPSLPGAPSTCSHSHHRLLGGPPAWLWKGGRSCTKARTKPQKRGHPQNRRRLT